MNKLLTILLVFGLVLSGCVTESSSVFTGVIPSHSIRELSQNSAEYVNQTVTLSGMVNSRVGGHSMEDADGYWVWLDDNCIEGQRDYDLNSRYYTAKGTWVAPKPKPNEYYISVGIDYKYRVSCAFPVE